MSADERTDVNPPCQGCGGPHPFDTSVPSVRWNAVIRAHGYPDYLCLTCIVKAFALANESFAATLWGGFFNGLPISVRVNDQPSVDVAAISVENTRLRAIIREYEERLESLSEDADDEPDMPVGKPWTDEEIHEMRALAVKADLKHARELLEANGYSIAKFEGTPNGPPASDAVGQPSSETSGGSTRAEKTSSFSPSSLDQKDHG